MWLPVVFAMENDMRMTVTCLSIVIPLERKPAAQTWPKHCQKLRTEVREELHGNSTNPKKLMRILLGDCLHIQEKPSPPKKPKNDAIFRLFYSNFSEG